MERLDDYATWTDTTSRYTAACTGNLEALSFLALGLAGEAGEIANCVKDMALKREDTSQARAALAKDVGDALWYVARLARELNVPLSQLAAENMAKCEGLKPTRA
jgi:NTP pyrophosphatase (non-canonical NTP hydrolase)